MLVLHVVEHKSLFVLKRTFFAKNANIGHVKNLQNINIGTIKQVFTAINGILILKLVGMGTETKVLS